MATDWDLFIKPTFLTELNALPPKEVAQIQKKLALLADDPTPDAKTKKQLKYLDGKLHRIRSGDFRIFYTFEHPHISVLSLRRRDDETYDDEPPTEFLGRGAPPQDASPAPRRAQGQWDRWLGNGAPQAKSTPLPRAIDDGLLTALKVPAPFRAALAACGTEEALLECPVPQDVLSKVIDAVMARPIEQVVAQPDLVLDTPDDLLRFREGELLGFLLRLNPEQEKFVSWAVQGKGATLLKGGPGTGKSTVALYRVRAMVQALRKAGVDKPRILFTTYTRALARVSEQLLATLLGPDQRYVEVVTADKVAKEIGLGNGSATFAKNAPDIRDAIARALETASFRGNSLQVAAQRRAVQSFDKMFLQAEILGVIEARGLRTLEEYLETPRPGRRLALSKAQREGVWRVREAFVAALEARKLTTWESLRARAAEAVTSGKVAARYDAVLIDEAQDLSPTALRMLVGLCKTPGGVFLTADANQSIYGGGFRWSDVHEWLTFKRKTAVLRANHRTTREIAVGALSYLEAGTPGTLIDEEKDEARYVHNGPLPAVRAVATAADEARLLHRFFRSATRELRLGLGACAVLCPYNDSASRIAAALRDLGLDAAKVDAEELDLRSKGVKVLTLKNAKGLEFPIVAMAGFLDAPYPKLMAGVAEEEAAEVIERERRTMYVAMTRPMRALLVVIPEGTDAPLLGGFDPDRWSFGDHGGPS